MTDICLEMLSHRTPPESMPANIMTICKLISPNNNIVQELPGVDWVRKCRSIMVVETKTLGAMQIAAAEATVGHHADDTSRRGKGFGNCIVRVRNGPVFSNVALSSCIFAADGTAESGVASIQRTFREGRELLQNWRNVTAKMYPGNANLLAKLPDPSRLTLARLAKNGFLMTDTCDTARKFWRQLRAVIEAEALEQGMSADEINAYEADCWQHLRNVWIGAVVLKLGQHLLEVLQADLLAIPFLLCVTTDVGNLGRATEKYFDEQANYQKVSWSFIFSPSTANTNPSTETIVHPTTRGRAACSVGTQTRTTPVGISIP